MQDLSRLEVTASLSPWLIIDHYNRPHLFGFAQHHPLTKGLSWTMSTEVLLLQDKRALTVSGRLYQLGDEIIELELDEEGRLALDILLGRSNNHNDRTWIVARKIARHLDLTPPRRGSVQEIDKFLADNTSRYREIISAV